MVPLRDGLALLRGLLSGLLSRLLGQSPCSMVGMVCQLFLQRFELGLQGLVLFLQLGVLLVGRSL